MPDLDFARVIGRFGLVVGDTGSDPDDNPDTVWCTEGRVLLTPLITFTKVSGGSPVPWTGGQAVIECAIDSEGYLTYAPPGGGTITRYVDVVDLTSDKVNPKIADGKATHKVQFAGVKAGDTAVAFPPYDVRLVAAGDGVSPGGVNDLTVVAPVVPGAASPIYRGETGVGVSGAAIVDGTNLQLTLTDGTPVDAGELPVGPGGSDAGVAGYISSPGTETASALSASFAAISDLSGNPLTGQRARFVIDANGWLTDLIVEEI